MKNNQCDILDDLAHVLRHSECNNEQALREFVKKLRKCPYAGLDGALCKEIIKRRKANGSGRGKEKDISD